MAETTVPASVYESAVAGRAAFRTAFREQRELVAEARKIIEGLRCPGCKREGAAMAEKGGCSRDADCDAGWYGIHCDEVASFLAKLEPCADSTAPRCAAPMNFTPVSESAPDAPNTAE